MNDTIVEYPAGAQGTRVTYRCVAQVDFGTLVYMSAAGVVTETSADTDLAIGVALPDEVAESENGDTYYASGDAVVVALRGAGEVFNLTNTGGVTLGTLVEAAASGAVETHSGGTNDYKIVGIALETATTGNRGQVLLL